MRERSLLNWFNFQLPTIARDDQSKARRRHIEFPAWEGKSTLLEPSPAVLRSACRQKAGTVSRGVTEAQPL